MRGGARLAPRALGHVVRAGAALQVRAGLRQERWDGLQPHAQRVAGDVRVVQVAGQQQGDHAERGLAGVPRGTLLARRAVQFGQRGRELRRQELRVEALGGRLRRAHVCQVRLEGLQHGAFGADRVRPGGRQLVVVTGQAHEGGVHRAQLGVRAQVRPGLVVRVGHARVSSGAGVSCG